MCEKCNGTESIKVAPGKYKKCTCVYFKEAYRRYFNGGGLREFAKFPPHLTDNKPIGKKGTGKVLLKDELKHIDENLETLIKDRKHLVCFSEPRQGKSQFASTIMLMGCFREYTGLFLDLREIREYVKDYKQIQDLKNRVQQADIIILDDLGVEAVQDFYEVDTVNLIDWICRHHPGLLIVTTNKNVTNEQKLKETYPNGERLIKYLLEENKAEIYLFGV
jgi:DNA replication protein DnaC